MTDKTDNMKNKTPASVGKVQDRAGDGAVNARRALLKGAVATMPMILTLQSGAALARSSNLISASTASAALDANGRMLCLDYRYADSTYDNTNVVDVGDPPYAHVCAIKDDDYYISSNASNPTHREQMCHDGGTFFRKTASGFEETNYVPKGMLVSATALSSFAGHIDITEI